MLVAPTSRSAGAASFRPQVVFAGDETRVLAEQLGAVDVQRLGRQAGRFTAEEMWRVDEALKTILGLSKPASPLGSASKALCGILRRLGQWRL